MTPFPRHRLVTLTVFMLMAWSLLAPGPAQAMRTAAPAMPCQSAAAHHGDHQDASCQHAGTGCHCIQTCQTGAPPGSRLDSALRASLVLIAPRLPGQRHGGFPANPWRPPTP